MSGITRELARMAREIRAGDEWADEKTYAFVAKLAEEMARDRSVRVGRVQGNKIWFEYQVLMSRMPMVMDVMEFGHPPHSESLNGTIKSEENSSFRLPGGTTRKRDPREFWSRAKDMLVDIFKRALNG